MKKLREKGGGGGYCIAFKDVQPIQDFQQFVRLYAAKFK